MHRVGNADEKEFLRLISRITTNQDWWTSSPKPVPERIGFQRFGVQLRGEDFEQEGTTYRGFLIRNRSEGRVATSGFSEFKNNDGEFQVKVDVWPFQQNELFVEKVGNLYVKIIGEHKEKCEDNSECTRKFARHYFLPKGSTTVKECSYSNATLTITVEKTVKVEEEKPQKVPIGLESSKGVETPLFEEIHTPVTIDGRKMVIIALNQDLDSEPTAGADGSLKTDGNVSNVSEAATPCEGDTTGDKKETTDSSKAKTAAKEGSTIPESIPITCDDSPTNDKETANTPEAVVIPEKTAE